MCVLYVLYCTMYILYSMYFFVQYYDTLLCTVLVRNNVSLISMHYPIIEESSIAKYPSNQ